MKRIFAGVAVMAGLLTGACATVPAEPEARMAPISIHGNIQTFEIAPVLLAAEYYPGTATVKMGGIPNLVGEAPIGNFGSAGVADVATHAETQALRYSVRHPNLRILMNVTEGVYRIVARKSAGIARIADLKGKRVATIEQTSSGYFLHRMLATEGLSFADIVPVAVTPLSGMTEALRKGDVDAVVIWEPESENSAQVLGDDLVEFHGEGVYRELFNLNSTAENLADPEKRARIVRYVRAVIDAAAEVRRDPARAKTALIAASGFDPVDVDESWKHHRFNANLQPDLLDVLVLEEQWLAEREKRSPRSRAQLATLIDTSVYEEAMRLDMTGE